MGAELGGVDVGLGSSLDVVVEVGCGKMRETDKRLGGQGSDGGRAGTASSRAASQERAVNAGTEQCLPRRALFFIEAFLVCP